MDSVLWVVVAGCAVVGVKYYTAHSTSRLSRRLESVRLQLQKSRKQFKEVRIRQLEAVAEEKAMEERIRWMKEIQLDLQNRLMHREERAKTIDDYFRDDDSS